MAEMVLWRKIKGQRVFDGRSEFFGAKWETYLEQIWCENVERGRCNRHPEVSVSLCDMKVLPSFMQDK